MDIAALKAAAEHAKPIWKWRERGDNGRWHYTDVAPDDADRHWNEIHEVQPALDPTSILSLITRYQQMEEALRWALDTLGPNEDYRADLNRAKAALEPVQS